jgi:hypothetical protein
MEQVAVTMALFEFSEFFFALFDEPWIVYVWHAHIVPSKSGNGVKGRERRYGARARSPGLPRSDRELS